MTLLKSLNPKLLLILFGLLITNTGSFMILPFLSLYLNHMNLPTTTIGLVLMVNMICQRGLTFFGGILNDRFGEKKLLIIGMSIRLTGYILYSVASGLPLIFLASAFVGLGGALFAPGLMATIAKLAGAFKPQVFALRNTVINIGSSLGPILGGLLYQYSVFWVFLLTSLAHFIFLVLIILNGPNDIIAKRKIPVIASFRTILKNKTVLLLALMNAIFWFLYSQFNLSIPLYMKIFFNQPSITGLVFTINGVFVIFLQYVIAKLAFQRCKNQTILISGFLFMGIAYFTLGLIPHLSSVFLFVLLFSMSEVLVFPTIDNLVSDLADEALLSTYYGFVDIGWAIGATLGNLLGGIFIGFAQNHHLFVIIWIGYGCLSILALPLIFLMVSLNRIASKRRAQAKGEI